MAKKKQKPAKPAKPVVVKPESQYERPPDPVIIEPEFQYKPSFREQAISFLRMHKRQWRMVLGGLGVLLLLVAAVLFWRQWDINRKSEANLKSEDRATIIKRVEQTKKAGELRDQAKEHIKAGRVAEADALYEQAVQANTDSTEKVKLYLDLSSIYYENDLSVQAFQTANKAESASSDRFLAAVWLSRLYEVEADYQQAAKYYRLAAEWAESGQNHTGMSKAEFEQEANRVQGLAQ